MIACEKAILWRNSTYRLTGEGDLSAEAEAQGMSLMLFPEVPAVAIRSLMIDTSKKKPNGFPANAKDMLRNWRGEEWIEVEGKEEKVVVANASAYQPLKPTPGEQFFKGTKALPEGDSEAYKQFQALREKLWPARSVYTDGATDDKIFSALYLQCNFPGKFEITDEQKIQFLSFGKWWLQSTRIQLWSAEKAHKAWFEWQGIDATDEVFSEPEAAA